MSVLVSIIAMITIVTIVKQYEQYQIKKGSQEALKVIKDMDPTILKHILEHNNNKTI